MDQEKFADEGKYALVRTFDVTYRHIIIIKAEEINPKCMTVLATGSSPLGNPFTINSKDDADYPNFIKFNENAEYEIHNDIGEKDKPIYGIYIGRSAIVNSSSEHTIFTIEYQWDFSSEIGDNLTIDAVGRSSIPCSYNPISEYFE